MNGRPLDPGGSLALSHVRPPFLLLKTKIAPTPRAKQVTDTATK
jgi:hypothetical protein